MGTKIKNHFRAENWIKIKPKMWFNQVRIILFYIIQIKIKLNVKPKMPHVSDQYRGATFEYKNISKYVTTWYQNYSRVQLKWLLSRTRAILSLHARASGSVIKKTRDRSEVSVNERYKYRIFVISNNEWVMPEGIKNWSITDLFKIFNFTQDLKNHVIWLQILIFVQNLKICESARDEIQRYWGLYELLSYPEERMNRIIGIGWPWTHRTNYYSLTILNLPGDMLTINWLGWKNKQPSTKWKYMTHHVTVWLI